MKYSLSPQVIGLLGQPVLPSTLLLRQRLIRTLRNSLAWSMRLLQPCRLCGYLLHELELGHDGYAGGLEAIHVH